MRSAVTALALICLPLVTGCANVSGSVAPGANLAAARSFYVVRDAQSDATDAVQKDLARRGLTATTGPESQMPRYGVDCKVLVRDKWMWDITMYLIDLEVDLVHPTTGAPIASAKSHRPSLQRKSPEEMAAEVLDKILSAGAK